MAQESKDKEREVDEDDGSEAEGSSESSESMSAADDKALAKPDDEAAGEDDAAGEGGEGGQGEEGTAAAQLGSDRYVLAGFFATGMLGAYILGKAIQGLWIFASNKSWFAENFRQLAAVSDEDKGTYGVLVGGLIALIAVYRTYKTPSVRTWSDEVAAELAKVVWPSRKEVTNSTFIVIVASAAATLYLALLDRLWAFVTNIVYGDGS
jgi:preprotein translocase subunit SecE